MTWVANGLKVIPKSDTTGALPYHQVDAKLTRFCDGLTMTWPTDMHLARPHPKSIWEFKTVDVRLFGWIPFVNYLVLHCGEDAQKLHDDVALYDPFVAATAEFRDSHPSQFPGPLTSGNLSDVLSIRP